MYRLHLSDAIKGKWADDLQKPLLALKWQHSMIVGTLILSLLVFLYIDLFAGSAFPGNTRICNWIFTAVTSLFLLLTILRNLNERVAFTMAGYTFLLMLYLPLFITPTLNDATYHFGFNTLGSNFILLITSCFFLKPAHVLVYALLSLIFYFASLKVILLRDGELLPLQQTITLVFMLMMGISVALKYYIHFLKQQSQAMPETRQALDDTLSQLNDTRLKLVQTLEANNLSSGLLSDAGKLIDQIKPDPGKNQALAEKCTGLRQKITTALNQQPTPLPDTLLETLHHKMVEQLQQCYPSLTEHDANACILFNAGLKTKEVASHSDISIDSMYKSRLRIRQKMGLKQHDKMETAIQECLSKLMSEYDELMELREKERNADEADTL